MADYSNSLVPDEAKNHLNFRSTRTPPALPFVPSHHFAISTTLIVSVQAWPPSDPDSTQRPGNSRRHHFSLTHSIGTIPRGVNATEMDEPTGCTSPAIRG